VVKERRYEFLDGNARLPLRKIEGRIVSDFGNEPGIGSHGLWRFVESEVMLFAVNVSDGILSISGILGRFLL
jgi:hypothetical protein